MYKQSHTAMSLCAFLAKAIRLGNTVSICQPIHAKEISIEYAMATVNAPIYNNTKIFEYAMVTVNIPI